MMCCTVGLCASQSSAAETASSQITNVSSASSWASQTPAALARDFIQADTFLDEEVRPWRGEMARRFVPVVKDCKTRREAILTVAQQAAAVCGVKYSTERRAANQSVAESLESGKASCTGLSILLAAAYRAVGIPARLAGVGEWGDRPGNHTWVEVWDEDGWHAVEYYPDAKGLDHGWIYEPIARLDPANPRSRVFAVDPQGATTFFLPWAPGDHSHRAVDRTEEYVKTAGGRKTAATETGTVVFEAHNQAGERLALSFRVLDSEKELFTGTTPGPLDDRNNAPHAELPAGRSLIVVFRNPTGVERREKIEAKRGERIEVHLPA